MSAQTGNIVINNATTGINLTGIVTAINFENFTITTGSGNDTITQSGLVNNIVVRGNDTINSGAGNDTINTGLGIDSANGGAGDDLLIVNYSIGETGREMTLSTYAGAEGFSGSAYRLNSAGNAYPDQLSFSGINRFQITGTGANDYITTGGGNDTINAGAGKDTLTGGLGSDKFVYQNLTDSLLANFDVITDFNATTGNDLFRVSTARAGFVNVGAVNTLDTAGISTKLTAAAFGSNFAAQFSFGQKTFVAINDATAGFNAANDAIIEVTGLTGILGLNNFTTV